MTLARPFARRRLAVASIGVAAAIAAHGAGVLAQGTTPALPAQGSAPASPAATAPGAATSTPFGTTAADTRPAQPIPFRKDDDAGDLVVRVALGLGVSLLVAFGILIAVRRYGTPLQRGTGRRLKLLESIRLTPKSALFLVSLDERTLLIGQQGETLVVLAEPGSRGTAGREVRDVG